MAALEATTALVAVSGASALPAPAGQWQSGLCACFIDCGICFYGACCLPCLYGENAHKMNGSSCFLHCCAYHLLAPFCAHACLAQANRRRMRERFNLPPATCCADCGIHFWCGPCAVCQEAREAKARGVVAYTPPTHQFLTASMVPPGQQAMAKA